MKVKLNLFCCLFLLYTSFFYSQKVGIISEINSKMGYVVFKGELFTEKAIFEKDLEYNFIDFINKYYKERNITPKNIDEFPFSMNFITSDELKYFQNLCKKNDIDELLIISKNKYYFENDPMSIYKNLNHELGIEAYVKAKTRALLYGNFQIYVYNLKNHNVKTVINKVYMIHRFKNPVFNESYNLVNKDVEKLFADDLEKLITKKMNKYYSK